jgi:hypothetical protein
MKKATTGYARNAAAAFGRLRGLGYIISAAMPKPSSRKPRAARSIRDAAIGRDQRVFGAQTGPNLRATHGIAPQRQEIASIEHEILTNAVTNGSKAILPFSVRIHKIEFHQLALSGVNGRRGSK